MRLVEAPSLQAGENQAKALSILHDEAYHQAKAKIMRPIGEFYDLVNQRTALAVQNAQATANLWRIAFIASARQRAGRPGADPAQFISY